mmetsp:Transcript_84245/g.260516  ORF Transcript_84245/g.260516 Transcript_84245/m.260516 type:complete len:462 (+) Transcript_84245:3-1388(+)
MPPLQIPRASFMAVVAGCAIYVLGGGGVRVEVFSLLEPHAWDVLPTQLPVRREVGCVAAALGQSIYVFGGCTKDGRPCPCADCLDLDAEGWGWTHLPSTPASHSYFPQAIEMDGAVYLFGGSQDGFVSKYEPWSGEWRLLPSMGEDLEGGGCYAACILPLAPRPSAPERPPLEAQRREGGRGGADPAESVIQEVLHPDAPAHIDPMEADAIGSLQHAGFLERIIKCSTDLASWSDAGCEDSQEGCSSERVVVLQIRRPPTKSPGEQFRKALLDKMWPCQKELERANSSWSCEQPTGVLVFVGPDLYPATMQSLVDKDFRRYHVVVSESWEYLIGEALSELPFKRRPRVRSPRQELELARRQESLGGDALSEGSDSVADVQRHQQQEFEAVHRAEPLGGDEASEGSDGEMDMQRLMIVERRTFLDVVPPLRESQSVVQSSTEPIGLDATHLSSRGVNPRRVA